MAIHGWLLVTSGLDEPSPPAGLATSCPCPSLLATTGSALTTRGRVPPGLPCSAHRDAHVGWKFYILPHGLSTEALQAQSVAAGGGGSSLGGSTFGHFLTMLFGRRYIPGERTDVNRCPISNSRGPVTTLPVKGDSGLWELRPFLGGKGTSAWLGPGGPRCGVAPGALGGESDVCSRRVYLLANVAQFKARGVETWTSTLSPALWPLRVTWGLGGKGEKARALCQGCNPFQGRGLGRVSVTLFRCTK